jgi:hypothetical protein
VAPQVATFTPVHYNDRFNITITSLAIDRMSRKAMVERQAKYQTRKMAEGWINRFGHSFYGFSTGVVCENATNVTSAGPTDYTLQNAYGLSDLNNAAYLAQAFASQDRVALIRSAALVTNAIGTVNSVNETTPSINVTWNGSVDADAGDQIVFANSVGNTVIGDTDYNQSPIGLFDMILSTSLHGLSGATYPNWTAYQNTDGGRFGITHYRKMRHRIANRGGGEPDTLIVAQGVDVDLAQNQFSFVRFGDPQNMALDGAVRTKERYFTSRKVPNKRVFLYDSDSVKIWHLEEFPSDEGSVPGPEDAGFDKVQDRNAKTYSFDFHYQLFCPNRANLAMASGLTEQAV